MKYKRWETRPKIPKIINKWLFVGSDISWDEWTNCWMPSTNSEKVSATKNVILNNIPTTSIRAQPNVFFNVFSFDIYSNIIIDFTNAKMLYYLIQLRYRIFCRFYNEIFKYSNFSIYEITGFQTLKPLT